jgi:hypothetical protein
LDWKQVLVIAHLVKNKIYEVDVEGLWENTLPEVAATSEQLDVLEQELGYPLDSQHRQFLMNANGWRAFMQHVDVFGVGDFKGGPRAARAIALIESLQPLDSLCGYSHRDLIPIAVSSSDIDVFVMARPHTATPGRVFWFAGGLIDTFQCFDEWFLSMVDYNRKEYHRLVATNVDA